MRCAEAFDAMLVADPSALRGEGESPLAVHVRGCSRCQYAATRIDRGTAALGAVLRDRQVAPSRRSNPAWAVGGAASAIAAALLIFAVLRRPVTEQAVQPLAAVPRISDSSGAVAEASGSREALLTHSRRDVSQELPTLDTSVVDDAAPVDVGVADSAAPIEVDSGAIVPDTASRPIEPAVEATVAVRTQPGQHAAVFRTSDPKITLVWLY